MTRLAHEWRLTRRQRRRASLRYAVGEDDLTRSLRDLISVVASVPEADRGAWFQSMQQYTSAPHHGIYDTRRVAGLWLQLANVIWPPWPQQDLAGRSGCPQAPGTPDAPSASGGPGEASP